jgi:hypothetical protein
MQHRECFIVGFLPYIRALIIHKNVMTHAKEVEIAMRLEVTLGGAKTLIRLAQVWLQLDNVTIQLQDMAKNKVMHAHIWCNTCRLKGHC